MLTMRSTLMSAIPLLMGAFGTPSVAIGQPTQIRGIIRDSATGAPIPGAVVVALNSAGATVERTVSRENGTYRLTWSSTLSSLQVTRIGFRPMTLPGLTLKSTRTALDIALASLPRAIEAMVVVTAKGCAERSDQGEALGLLDQARAGLLSMVVANEQQIPKMYVVRFDRLMDLNGIEVEHQSVHVDSTSEVSTSFNAVHNAFDFVEQGFRSGRNGAYTYFAPDATVLLDARFQRGYCFRLADRDPSRPSLMGLRFTPANRRGTQVDIDGILWVDTTARALSEITFRYLDVEPMAEAFGAGGDISFQTLSNGVAFIDRWRLRLIGGPDPESVASGRSVQGYAIREIGGELAEILWPDGTRWQAPLTALQVSVVNDKGRPVEGARVALLGTNYRATADVYGRASIQNVLPGEYAVSVSEPRLQSIHLDIPVNRTVTARRATTVIARIAIPKAESYLELLCRSADPDNQGIRILGRAMSESGQPVGGVSWQLSTIADGRSRAVTSVETAPESGIIHSCKRLELGTTVELAVWKGDDPVVHVRRILVDSLTIIPVTLPDHPAQKRPSGSNPVSQESSKTWIRRD